MPHIHTKPGQHDHTVSAIIVKIQSNEPKILLHRHKKLGRYLQFGGHIELDENPWQAIKHEIEEESGYTINQLKILQPKTRIKKLSQVSLHPYPLYHNTFQYGPGFSGHLHTDICYLFTTNQEPKLPIAKGESTEFKLFSKKEIEQSKEIDQAITEICLFIFDYALNDWEDINPKVFDQ